MGLGTCDFDLGVEVVGVVSFVGGHRLGQQLVDEILDIM